MTSPIKVYEASGAGIGQMVADIGAILQATDYDADAPINITPFPDLLGIDPEVYRHINSALNSGKRHLMFYGPPGTGKTTLARKVARSLAEDSRLVTGSSDWTSQDIIGGYQPMSGGAIRFFKGVLLEHFDKPLVIDELNRCDIDKVLGPLFTVLSGQPSVLPFLSDTGDENSPRYVILPEPKDAKEAHEFCPGPKWRLIATINSLDKASLYQMSYALTRRFGWVLVDVPKDTAGFVAEFLLRVEEDIDEMPDFTPAVVPLAKIWDAVNKVRPVGAAPIIDMIRFVRHQVEDFDHFAEITGPGDPRVLPLLDAFYTFILPMLDGILDERGTAIGDAVCGVLKINGDAREQTLRDRIQAMTI